MSSLGLLSPVVDIIFKKILGNDKVACLGFICAVLGWDRESVECLDIEFADKDLMPAYPDSKQGFLDVLVKLKDGTLINIEIQVTHQPFYAKRCLFYWSHKYHSQLGATGKYKDLKKVIGIHILTHNYFQEYTKMHNEFAICHKETGQIVKEMGDFELHFIELAKFNNEWTQDTLTHWCLFFKDPKMTIDKLDTDESLKRAYEELEKLSQDRSARLLYEARLKELRDLENIKDGALERGFAQGHQEGLQEGLQAGRQEGLQAGIKAMIHTMRKNGCTLTQIEQITSIPLEQIKEFLKQDL